MAGGFQQQIYEQPQAGIAGDFASMNPYFTFDAGPGGLVAGASGVKIGLFAWVTPPVDPNGTDQIVNNFGSGPVAGFVHRAQQGLITTYLADAGVTIQQGFQMGLMVGGDFWVVNDGSSEALPGMKAYANFTTGKVTFAATGSAPADAVASTWAITAGSGSYTGSIAGDVLTITVGTGLPVGAILSGSGVATGTQVLSQLTGTAGGPGTYLVSIPEQTVASTAISATWGILALTTVTSGVFKVGDSLTGATAGVTAGTVITALAGGGISGGGGIVNLTQSSSNSGQGNLTAAAAVETKWIAMSSGLAGEIVKISDHALG